MMTVYTAATASLPHLSQIHLGTCLLVVVLVGGWLLKRRGVWGTIESKPQRPSAPDYRLQFPPSRRSALRHLPGEDGSVESAFLSKDVQDPPWTLLQARPLPTTKPAPPLTENKLFTPTGFSTQDIAALGRFPDYAVLSGVRHPRPCGAKFDISRASFRPFRPLRWGYHQTMALMKMEPDYWIELERNYASTMAARRELLAKHGDRIHFAEPGSRLACRELMEMVVQFLCRRYPQYFVLAVPEADTGDARHHQDEKSGGGGGDDEGAGTVLVNKLLNSRTDLVATPPFDVLAANVPEDFALMLRSEVDGLYYLRAALVCSSVGWDVAQHRNEPLRDIHAHVPDYAEKMAFSMDRFFSRMPTDQPIQRCSWTLEDCAPLFSSPAVAEPWRRSAFAEADRHRATAVDVRLRCDWQTLRRLPLSGAVAFNFKAVFTPLARLRDEPFVPALLARLLREGRPHLMAPKAEDHVRALALGVLEPWAAEQVRRGVVPAGWEPRTLDEHPFYPGWEERWRAEQGF